MDKVYHRGGWIKVVTGPMFSGKTTEIIHHAQEATGNGEKVKAFKHFQDTRCSPNRIGSHDHVFWKAVSVRASSEILDLIESDTQMVAIDEGHFFEDGFPPLLTDICETLRKKGIKVIVAGCDLDFRVEPFHQMALLQRLAEQVIQLKARCTICGALAEYTQRLTDKQPSQYDETRFKVGSSDIYEPHCKNCHVVPNKPPGKRLVALAPNEDISPPPR